MPKCDACQFDNSGAMKFCGRCGGLLPLPCPSCQFINPTAYNFCGQCGKHLNTISEEINETIAQHQPNIKGQALNATPGTSAERRQLTVMFCDLADSALLSDCLDPEEFQYIIRRYQATCTEVINRFGGHIAQFLGDGILVYFSYPKANEDDARRAVYSAINCVKAIIKLNSSLCDTVKTLQIRIGIHTGLVVIGEIGTGSKIEHLALGRTPNIAARLQNLAAPNQVFITDSTYHLVRSFFRADSQGQKKLKGIHDPLNVYHVTQEIDVRDRFEAIQKQGNLIPIVGRQHEIKQLMHLWSQSLTGQGKVLFLVGETGVGKSRLLQAFKETINTQNSEKIFLTAYGTAYSETSSLRTIIEMLERTFQFTHDMDASSRFKSLEIQLSEAGFDLAYYLPLFSSLLHLPLADDYEELDLTAERKKKRTLEVVFEYIFKLSEKKPLLFIVEDLHWTDPSTLEFLELMVQQTAQHRMLALFTSRPRFNVPWRNRSEVNLLNLSHLKDQDISKMVEQLTQGQKLPQKITDEIIKKTDGIPLFVEEITQMVMESKNSRNSKNNDNYYLNLSIPSSLQDLLTARLDNLGRVRDVAQFAAVIGREFSYSLLEKITDNKATLQQDLKILIDSELIFQSGIGSQSCYIFKHALFQETAVFSMLKTRRQEVHRKIAMIAETQNPEIVTARPEYIALHYTRAGAIDSAIDWWLRAGELALKKSANIEAISHLEQGILLSESLNDTLSNNHRELSLRSAVGVAYCATTGYASKEVEQSYNHAWDLCKRLNDTSEQFPILWGQWAFHVVRANLSRALEIAMEMSKAANIQSNPDLLLEANMSIGLTHYFLGNFAQARDSLEASVKADKTDRDRSFTFRSGQDAGVCARSYLALTLWVLGHPADAKKCSEEAILLARTLNHPFSLTYALNFSSWLHYMLHDPQKAKIYAREELFLAEEHGFFWRTLGSVVAGWADTQIDVDAPEQGIIRLQMGINDYRLPGARLSQTFLLSIQASVCLELNMLDDVKPLLDEAITAIQETQEVFWLTEIYRLYGHLAQANGQTQAARNYLNKSIALAQKQGAPMLQLRATESMVRFSTTEDRPAALKLLIAAYAKIDKDSELVDCHNVEQLIEPSAH